MSSVGSAKLWKYFKLMFKWGSIFHAHPYQWNEELDRGQLCTSKWKLAVWHLNVGMTAAYSIYLVAQGVKITVDGGSSKIEKVYIKFILFFWALPALYQAGLWVKKNDLAPLYYLNTTALRIFDENISNQSEEEQATEEGNNENPKPRKCLMPKFLDVFFDFVWCGFLGMIPAIGLLNILRPQSPEFLSAVWTPDSGIFRLPLILLSAFFQMYYAFTYSGSSFLYIYMGFGSLIPAVIALVQTKGWLIHRDELEKYSPEQIHRIFQMYRSITLIMGVVEDVFCDFLVPAAKGILVCLCVFCAYGVVRMDGFLVAYLAVIGLFAAGLLIVMIATMAMFDSESREILQLMREPSFQDSLTLGQRKEVNSLHVIQLRMRRGYVLDKACVTRVYRIIVESTAELLVSRY